MPPISAPPTGNEKSCVTIQTLTRRKEEAVHRSTRVHTCETQVNVVKYRGIHRIVALVKVISAEVVTDPLLAQAPVSKSSRTPADWLRQL